MQQFRAFATWAGEEGPVPLTVVGKSG